MREEGILVPVKLNRQIFRRFAFFDTFYHQKHWKRPLLFALMMSVFAGICLVFRQRQEGAALLGIVLLAVGLGLPLVYLLSYWLSLRQQMKEMDLSGGKIVYTLHLEPGGIQVTAGAQKASCTWETVYMAYRAPGCIYLYVRRNQAYLLPEGPDSRRLWTLLEACLPPEKLRSFLKEGQGN